jgi:hypothetical protein
MMLIAIKMHWQQWLMVFVQFCNIVVTLGTKSLFTFALRATLTTAIVWALWSGGFFTGGLIP